MPAKLFCTILLIQLLNLVTLVPTTSATSLVHSIDENGVLLVPSVNKYYLRIFADGTTREETVEEISPGLLQVKGTLRHPFPGSKFLLVVYEAGSNGYVAKYEFPVVQTSIQRLNPATLKTAAG
ncbi:uncharacterized protein [Drosophila takahashii]|uniref:uncharacterized protein n=1 Tax=Drosophila takahashii TaxID=29030 RepID=UPI0038995F01